MNDLGKLLLTFLPVWFVNAFLTFLTFWPVWLVGSLLIYIAYQFRVSFVLPARRLGEGIAKALSVLDTIQARGGSPLVELSEIKAGMNATPELAHAWGQYEETLHPQYKVDVATGQTHLDCWRETALAETFFSTKDIVDTPLKADLYKHLPGILTGLGIIGTFLGLIQGLTAFDPTDQEHLSTQLEALLKAVAQAFYVSGSAITLAMLFTWIEKTLITARYRELTCIVLRLDSFFDAGVGEEYLAQLVKATDTQATQALQIKDALVEDLKILLTTLADKQMEAQSRSTERVLQAQIEAQSQSTERVLQAQAEHFREVAQQVGKAIADQQGNAVTKMLEDVIRAFSGTMEKMFGGQMEGMAGLLKQTSEAMEKSAEKFTTLATNMDAAGQRVADIMLAKMNEAITAMDMRQQVMNTQMGVFVEQINQLVSKSQEESARKLQETLEKVGQQQERFEQSTDKAVESLSSKIESLMSQLVDTNRSLENTVAQLSGVTTQAIAGMNDGAKTLTTAVADFAKAGQGVADTMKAAGEATGNIKVASGTLSAATAAVKDVLADYGRTRDAFANMVTELKSVTENARRDAAMTSEIIARIESATGKLGEAQIQVEKYLEGIKQVLVETHESFAEQVVQTLGKGNSKFQEELRTAVAILSTAIKDLGETLEDIPDKRR